MTHPGEAYREAVGLHDAARDEAHRASVRLSRIRGLTFVAAAGAFLGWDVLEGTAATVALVAGLLLVVVFLVEVVAHRRLRRTERWEETLLGLAREGVHRLDRRWKELEEALPAGERVLEAPAPDHPYARDLDVVGRASLVRLLGPVTSVAGRSLLLQWLLAPAPPTEVRARQEAVRELAPRRALRAEFAAHGRLDAPKEARALDPFLAWAEEESWLASRRWIVWAARILPPVVLGLLAANVFFGLDPWWILPGLAQLEVLRRTADVLPPQLRAAESGGGPLRAWVPQIRLVEEAEATAPRLRELRDALREDGSSASERLGRLSGLLDTVESRRNMVWATLVPVLLLDVHLAWRLDRWRTRHGSAVRRWLRALARWEALAALATLAHDHPDWAWPEVVDAPGSGDAALPGATVLEARAVGHPLLRPGACVRNDVTVGPPETFLLVTGSNMSGKSTLLRALGTNAVLAQAGGPVCAEAFRLPALRVHSSMRIDDSLAQGVSLFMAELLRVRDIVRAAEEPGPPVFYLLDEILHGTNTAERRVAARGVIRHLLEVGAIGAVSTHDLTLARSPDLEKAAQAVHFREEVEETAEGATRLRFDYTLRPGIATTRNALKLLEAVGLGGLELEEEEGPEGG